MTMLQLSRRLAAVGAVAAATLAVGSGAPAGAADPGPTPCNDTLLTDPSGDQVYDPLGSAGPLGPAEGKGPDSLDITSLFFNYKAGADGKKALTANIVIKNLKADDIPSGAGSTGGNWYYVVW